MKDLNCVKSIQVLEVQIRWLTYQMFNKFVSVTHLIYPGGFDVLCMDKHFQVATNKLRSHVRTIGMGMWGVVSD